MPAKFPDRSTQPPDQPNGGYRNVFSAYDPRKPDKLVRLLPSTLGPGVKHLAVDCDLPADVAEKIYRMLLQHL